MECKFSKSVILAVVCVIKIYPEWNVNIESEDSEKTVYGIKIYPEWNVNFDLKNSFSAMSD